MERSLHINITPIRLTLNIISPVGAINLTGVDCSKMLLLEAQSEKLVSVLGYLCICCRMILTLTQSKRTSRIIDWCESCLWLSVCIFLIYSEKLLIFYNLFNCGNGYFVIRNLIERFFWKRYWLFHNLSTLQRYIILMKIFYCMT